MFFLWLCKDSKLMPHLTPPLVLPVALLHQMTCAVSSWWGWWGVWVTPGRDEKEHQECVSNVYIASRLTQEVKVISAAQPKQVETYIGSDDLGRCRRRMITLLTMAKETMNTEQKAMVNYSCFFNQENHMDRTCKMIEDIVLAG